MSTILNHDLFSSNFSGAFSYSFDFETYEMSAFEKYIYEFGNFESSFGCIMSNDDGSIDIRDPRTKMVGTGLDQDHTGTKTFLKFSDKLDRAWAWRFVDP